MHRPDGSLVQGMTGASPQPAAVQSGYVGKRYSADGSHLVFGSTSKFEGVGDAGGSIYDRNLVAKTTQVVSTLPSGTTMTGGGVGELDISEDGSRILVGKKFSTDGEGNDYWHPYMHIGTSPNSVDLAPTTTTGVLFGGMTADGSAAFFSSKDKLIGADTDESADVYRAQVSGGGALTLTLVSVGAGGPSNDNSCTPPNYPVSWNSVSGNGKCGAVVLAGGSGLAKGDGTLYFLSPEKLDGPANGTPNQPNLYVVSPGGTPAFVATLDSSLAKPPPPGELHEVASPDFVTGLSGPEATTVDQSNGDVYTIEPGAAGKVARFDRAGRRRTSPPAPGSAPTGSPGLKVPTGEAQVAVDNSGGPLNGSIYVTNPPNVSVYAPAGEKLGDITGAGNFFGELFTPCGVTVDQSDGDVYIGSTEGVVWRYQPLVAAAAPIDDADYTVTGMLPGYAPCSVAADSNGGVFVSAIGGGALKRFDDTEFGGGFPPSGSGDQIAPASNAVAVDPQNDDLYINDGGQISRYGETGALLSQFGSGALGGSSSGIGVNETSGHLYAPNGANLVEFGPLSPAPYDPIAHPAVIHAANDNEVHRWDDFQVTANGDYALFDGKLQLDPEYDNGGFNMVQRYDAGNEELDCASCLPTEGLPTADAALPGHGLGITEDGEAFFNSLDQLVMRDTNGKLDAYEWKDGGISLISTGFSAFPSSLLTVSSDGTDAFFFTRETLVPSDVNGQAMKLYDAREEGGKFVVPSSPPCAASDECHGPGTEAAAPPPIGSFKGVGGQKTPTKCKKGHVKKGDKCKRKKKRNAGKHRHKGNHRARAAKAGRGGNR